MSTRDLRRRSWSTVPVHPLLLAAFPVLFLFAENAVQQVTLDPLWLPLAASVAGALVVMAVAAALFRDWRRGALLASVLVVLFFSFGHVWAVARSTGWLVDRSHLAVIFGLLAVAGVILAWRLRRGVASLTTGLNVAAAILVAFNVVRIGEFALGMDRAAPERPPAATAAVSMPVAPPANRRDIYYVILDRYSNTETLRKIYDFDNRPFLDELRARGFAVAEDSWANYFKTAFSLVSSLNMEYLDGETLKDGDPPTFEPLHRALRDHLLVPSTLTSLGYEYVHIGNHWEPSATNVDADRVLRYASGSEFSSALLGTTAWALTQPPEEPTNLSEVEQDMLGMGYREMARAHTLYAFDRLEEAAGRPGPTFVFAHILIPHTPWRFNADGSFPTAAELSARSNDESYVHQLQWGNVRVLDALETILDAPEGEEPIVILQADEGEFPDAFARNQTYFDWLSATPDQIQHKFGILNAVHLPGVDAEAAGFHQRISPVNTFRIVLNEYFGADLPLLPDRTFLSPNYVRMYDFVEYERP